MAWLQTANNQKTSIHLIAYMSLLSRTTISNDFNFYFPGINARNKTKIVQGWYFPGEIGNHSCTKLGIPIINELFMAYSDSIQPVEAIQAIPAGEFRIFE